MPLDDAEWAMGRREFSLPMALILGAALGASAPALVFFATPNPVDPPSVVFAAPRNLPTVTQVTVESVDRLAAVSGFRARLSLGGAQLGAIDPLEANLAGALEFLDIEPRGRLSRGDLFYTAWTNPGDYELVLDWRLTDRVAAQVAWEIRLPLISLEIDSSSWEEATIEVASVDTEHPLETYTADVRGSGHPWALMSPIANGTSYDGKVVFFDADELGTLSAGDSFTVRLGAYTEYELAVRWRGNEVVRISWLP